MNVKNPRLLFLEIGKKRGENDSIFKAVGEWNTVLFFQNSGKCRQNSCKKKID